MYLQIKRGLDFLLSLLGIVMLSPFYLVIVIFIKAESPGPILFKQKRVGKDKTHFNILKFRTMFIDTPRDVPTHLLADPDRYITRTGKFLRRFSLDELPQLFNIFSGQMSIVGPRPALWNQYDLLAERDRYNANSVTPGLTGWAQIHGRDELPIPVKAEYDGYYANHISFGMDVKIIFFTFFKVLAAEGVKEGQEIKNNLPASQGLEDSTLLVDIQGKEGQPIECGHHRED